MNQVSVTPEGILVCSCGARCHPSGSQIRFRRRHLSLCTERATFTKQLAQGARSVEDEERRAQEPGRVSLL